MRESVEGRTRIKVLGGSALGRGTFAFSDYDFCCNPACADYDWLVVLDELPVDRLPLACPRERTILCTWEPVSIKSYSRPYVLQFGHLLTNRPFEAERHPHCHLGRGYFPSFVHDLPSGFGFIVKSKALSTVCSSKQMRHTKHHARFQLTMTLKEAIPEMDWFGKGVRTLERKEDALLPYKYHVAVENHIGARHWTEKFSDAILCECLPFYAGDPMLTEIFPADCFIPIPIDDPKEAVRIVRTAMAADEYGRRREAVLEAKRLIAEKYNFCAQVVSVIEDAGGLHLSSANRQPEFLYARRALRRISLRAALEDGWSHVARRLRLDLL